MNKKYHYDNKSDSLYIYIKKGAEEDFEEIVPGINIELNEKREILGIEILQASRFFEKNKEKIQAKNQAL